MMVSCLKNFLLLFITYISLGHGAIDFDADITQPFNYWQFEDFETNDYNLTSDLNTTVLMNYGADLEFITNYSHNVSPVMFTQTGYLYGYKFYVKEIQPVRLSVWRFVPCSGDLNVYDGCDDVFQYREDRYSLIHVTETIYPQSLGFNTYYFSRALPVDTLCFVGVTYGRINPIPFIIESDCANSWPNVRYTSPQDSEEFRYTDNYQTEGTHDYNFNHNTGDCKVYALQALLNPSVDTSGDCGMLQTTMDFQEYTVLSHASFPSHYSDNFDNCTIIRSSSDDSVLFIRAYVFGVENHGSCDYDRLSIYTYYPDDVERSHGPYCGSGGNSHVFTLLASSRTYARLEFHTDHSVTNQGYKLEVRSIPLDLYADYDNTPDYVWPWDYPTWTEPTTSTPNYPWWITQPTAQVYTSSTQEPDSGASGIDSWSIGEKIGLGIGVAVGAIVLLIIACCCCCGCCDNKKDAKKSRVHSTPDTALRSGPTVHASGLPMGKTSAKTSQGVYMLPSGGQFPRQPQPQTPPPPYPISQSQQPQVPPVGHTLPTQPARYPPQQGGIPSNYPPNNPFLLQMQQSQQSPYPLQPPSQLPPMQQEPRQPPRWSMGDVAFALVQPKPLKPIGASFGTEQERKTREEMYALGRARLNWQQSALIPGPAVYVEPDRSRSSTSAPGRTSGSIPPPPPPISGRAPGSMPPLPQPMSGRAPGSIPPPPPPITMRRQEDSWMYADIQDD